MNSFKQNDRYEKRRAKDINLKAVFAVLMRRYLIILIITGMTSVLGVFIQIKSTNPIPQYQSSSRIIIGADEESRKTLQVIVRDSTILDKVIKKLDLKMTSDSLAGKITVSSIESSQVVSIGVIDQDPILAAKIADTTAQVFKDEVPIIIGQDYVRLLSNAKVSHIPINQTQSNKVMYFLIFGLVVGIGIAFLIESFDDSIKSESDAEMLLEVPLLGKVSKMNKRNIKKKSHLQYNLEFRGESIGNK
ncbi:YveK family protein [Neobacillus cucumis]|uniref:YveK family protein n=1 Tax=Neobacillus cucumis TaxID=1740721 RepID=UPI0019653283|nr:capsular biosynthesis protein [Neobacillus cucumis]MBM7651869.1 capsular polysaccharide biosynthesis protein [Neobacillus cucumis]